MCKIQKEIPVEKTEMFRGRIFTVSSDVVLLPDGRRVGREYVGHPGGVCVAALTDDGCLLTVKQYRYGAGAVTLELPAGKLEPGEDPADAIRRELSEETGVTAEKWTYLGPIYPTPAYCGEVIHLYLAENLCFGEAHPDDGEFLVVERVSLDELYRLAMAGELPDAKTQIGVLRVFAGRFGK